MRLPNRRLLLAAASIVLAAGLAACGPKGAAVTTDDMTLGDPKAPVTMIEYASVACPHCAVFNNEVFPAFKAKYIDTGKVHYVGREMLTGNAQVAAAGFLVARCAGKDKYFAVTDALYRAQDEMFASGNPRPVLLRVAQSAGLSEAQFNTCINDEKALNAINERNTKYATEQKIDGTPTFVINGKTVATGEVTLAQLEKAVAEAQAKK